MEKVSYRLDNFEGPLDLLLTLIQKNKVSIYDIPILEITDQYIEIINSEENADLDYTGEFLVMASQLLYIKSKMLLPKKEEEEEEDPREDLANRLILYKKYKEASMELRKDEFATKNMIFRESERSLSQEPQLLTTFYCISGFASRREAFFASFSIYNFIRTLVPIFYLCSNRESYENGMFPKSRRS